MFFQATDYKKVNSLHRSCQNMHGRLVSEALLNFEKGRFYPWPEKINVQGKWMVCGAKWQNEIIHASPLAALKDLISPLNGAIVNAGYSFMPAHCEIAAHEGYTGSVLRFHYGLKVPKGDCAIRVDKDVRHWADGDALLFDDTKEHQAWNRTNEYRMIIIIDIRKSELDDFVELPSKRT